jgi:hypothetical protein
VLYARSQAVTVDTICGDNATLFAINNTPDYPRQEVIAIECATGPLIRASAAQIGKNGDRAYVLVHAGKKGPEEIVAKTKGLFADVSKVSGEWQFDKLPGSLGLMQQFRSSLWARMRWPTPQSR